MPQAITPTTTTPTIINVSACTCHLMVTTFMAFVGAFILLLHRYDTRDPLFLASFDFKTQLSEDLATAPPVAVHLFDSDW